MYLLQKLISPGSSRQEQFCRKKGFKFWAFHPNTPTMQDLSQISHVSLCCPPKSNSATEAELKARDMRAFIS